MWPLFSESFLLLFFIGASCLCCHVVFSFFSSFLCWPCKRVNCFRFDDEAIDCVCFYGFEFGFGFGLGFVFVFVLILVVVILWCWYWQHPFWEKFVLCVSVYSGGVLTWPNKLVSVCHFEQSWEVLAILSDCSLNLLVYLVTKKGSAKFWLSALKFAQIEVQGTQLF